MWGKLKLRQNIVAVVAVLYLLPIVIICIYSMQYFPLPLIWTVFSLGLLLTVAGSLCIFYLLCSWEDVWKRNIEIASFPPEHSLPSEEILEITAAAEPFVEAEVAAESEETLRLKEELEKLQLEVIQLRDQQEIYFKEISSRDDQTAKLFQEEKQLREELGKVKEEFKLHKQSSESQLEKEKILSNQYQDTIFQVRAEMEKKQEHVEKLENKIQDLTYEIKTLLQLADLGLQALPETLEEPLEGGEGSIIKETPSQYQVSVESVKVAMKSPEQAKEHLKRCIDIAQKVTGSHHFGRNNMRLGEFTFDNYALDLRRLCESLRSENQCTVFVYSPKESKLLFVNNQIKDLLGWSPERFVQDFESIVQEGFHDWRSSLSHITSVKETQTRLVMKTRAGQDVLVQCELGIIPTGIFRNNIIGILSTTK